MKFNLIRRFNDKKEKETFLAGQVEQNVFFSKYIVMLISIFEVVMIIYALVKGNLQYTYNKLYLAGYIFLFICSVTTCVIAWVHENKRPFQPKVLEAINISYFIIIVAWSVLISVLDSHNHYQLLVYLTVVMGAASAVRLRLGVSVTVQTISGIVMLLLLAFVAGCGFDVGQSINVFVFVAISIAITLAEHNRDLEVFRQNSVIEKSNEKLSVLNAELNAAYEQMKLLATQDPLTKLKNRTTLNKDLEDMLSECKKANSLMCCAILDIDNFKNVNDTYGHLTGDEGLRAIADVLRETLNGEHVYRFGGEEFVLIESGMDENEIYALLEQVRLRISEIELNQDTLKLTSSIGFFVQVVDENTTADLMLSSADRALYSAKRHGKNRVSSAPQKK